MFEISVVSLYMKVRQQRSQVLCWGNKLFGVVFCNLGPIFEIIFFLVLIFHVFMGLCYEPNTRIA